MLSCIHQRAGLRDTGRVRSQSARTRLLRFLTAAANRTDDRTVRMTQDQIGQVIGISRQHHNGLMRDLAAAGLLKRRYGGVRLVAQPLRL